MENVLAGAVVALIVGSGSLGFGWARGRYDRRTVRAWLQANTRDEPCETHVDTATVAKGTGLPDERVRRACMSDKRIYREPGQDRWSVWRAEPQSIYEKRGLLVF